VEGGICERKIEWATSQQGKPNWDRCKKKYDTREFYLKQIMRGKCISDKFRYNIHEAELNNFEKCLKSKNGTYPPTSANPHWNNWPEHVQYDPYLSPD